MEKDRQQDIKKTIRKTYGKIALQDNNEAGSFSGSCCALDVVPAEIRQSK
jgi:hypothetical protein